MSNLFFLLAADPAAKAPGSSMMMFLIYGGFIAFMWFVLIRPQRKKQKEISRMQNEIEIGQSVLTSGGLYGKVVDTVNDILIVEFGMNKGVRVPVQRSTVMSVAEPDLSIAKTEE
jgi:preprotein translocase subunit YajC